MCHMAYCRSWRSRTLQVLQVIGLDSVSRNKRPFDTAISVICHFPMFALITKGFLPLEDLCRFAQVSTVSYTLIERVHNTVDKEIHRKTFFLLDSPFWTIAIYMKISKISISLSHSWTDNTVSVQHKRGIKSGNRKYYFVVDRLCLLVLSL